MKSIFDKENSNEVIQRINSLNENSSALWGKMSVTQMVRHCSICEEYYLGNVKIKRSFLGRILGKVAINAILKDDKTRFRKNSMTAPHFKVSDPVLNLESEKEVWKEFITRYESFRNDSFTHWFFGKMTKEQLGQLIYKHSDHHLRQFGV